MFLNSIRIEGGTSVRGHMAMALKLLEMPPDLRGVVVECGTFKGNSAANLSLLCRITGRRLRIYDSFAGLPPPYEGNLVGTLDEVKANITRYGAIEVCEFHKGWVEHTLPNLETPVVLAWLDVDLHSSLDTCVRHIWPWLVEDGYIFTDECWKMDYVALFWSEKWWRENFDQAPPGLVGSGTGLGLGNFWIGPREDRWNHPLQHPATAGYTQKSFRNGWPFETVEEVRSGS